MAEQPEGGARARHERIERLVGRRIRERRVQLGLTQQQLATMIGVTYQQTHKYERGVNRVSAARLHDLAGALGVEVSFFFAGLELEQEPRPPERQRLSLDLSRNFARIADERCREALAQLCRAIAQAGPEGGGDPRVGPGS